MVETVRVTSKGQLTLPKGCREALGIKRGDILQVEAVGPSRLILRTTKASPAGGATRREGVVRRTAGLLSQAELDQEYIDRLRRESSRRLRDLYEGSS